MHAFAILAPTFLALASSAAAFSIPSLLNDLGVAPLLQCPLQKLPLSCSTTKKVDGCCTATPGGYLLQTQFWDTDPATGPTDSWTIHGLWPDNCDGTYNSYCDDSRAYTNITDILAAGGIEGKATLAYMKKYWKDEDGEDETFYEHEWAKHGTCISTFNTSCYGNLYSHQQEVVDYFAVTVATFKKLPTYDWLKAAGITPSATKTYPLDKVVSVLTKHHGQAPILSCVDGALSEVWYGFHARGPVQWGLFEAAAPDSTEGDGACPEEVKYLPKKE